MGVQNIFPVISAYRRFVLKSNAIEGPLKIAQVNLPQNVRSHISRAAKSASDNKAQTLFWTISAIISNYRTPDKL